MGRVSVCCSAQNCGVRLLLILIVFMVIKMYSTAEVYPTVGGQTFLLSVALVLRLPYPVNLGNDFATLLHLILQAGLNKLLKSVA